MRRGLDPEWITSPWASVGTLRSLKLVTGVLDARDWAFVERFAETLETLELRFVAFDESEEEAPPTFTTPLPHRRHLTLLTRLEDAASILSFLDKSPLTTLDLMISGNVADLKPATPLANAVEGVLSTIRHLRCTSQAFSPLVHGQLSWLQALCARYNIHLSHRAEYSAYYTTLDFAVPGALTSETDVLCSSAMQALAFGVGRVEAFRKTGDLEGLKLMLEITKALKALEDIWRD